MKLGGYRNVEDLEGVIGGKKYHQNILYEKKSQYE